MPRPRALSDPSRTGPRLAGSPDRFGIDPAAVRVTAEPHAGAPRGPGLRRFWGLVPLAIAIGLLALRALLHTPPLERLALSPAAPGDPPGAIARHGSLAIARGGSVLVGFDSPGTAHLTIAGHALLAAAPEGGLVTRRIVLPAGPAPLRFVAPPGARLVWIPVGRWSVLEHVPASSLSPEPPESARFDAPGTALLDGGIALGLFSTLAATLVILARRRLAAVSRGQWLAMGGVLAAGLAARLVGLGDAGPTWDEDVYWSAGRNYITSLLELDFSAAAWRWNDEHPPVMKLLAGAAAQLSDGFGPARAMSALWSSLGCALLVPIGTRLYRFRAGVLAALIAALLPPVVAHGQIVGHEAPSLLWWSLAVLLSLGVHDYLPSGDRGLAVLRVRLAWVGAVIGVAISSRFVNGLAAPLCALIVVIQAPERWRRPTLIWGAILMPLLALATCYALWPRLWGEPIAALAAAFDKLDNLHAPEPFLGALTDRPGLHYFPVYLFATLPAGILAAVLAWGVRAARERDRAALILLAWLAAPLLAALSPVVQDGVRYVLPCFASLALMAAAGLDAIAVALAGLSARGGAAAASPGRPPTSPGHAPTNPGASGSMRIARGRRPFLALAAATTAYLCATLWRSAPYHLDYFGEHVGGASGVAERRWLETGWWGEGLDRAIAYVNEHAAPGARVYLECVVPRHLAPLRADLWAPLTKDQREAAWIVAYSPATRACPLLPGARQVFAVVHDGVTLAAVYQREP